MNYETFKLFADSMLLLAALSSLTLVTVLNIVLDSRNPEKKKFRLPWKKKTEQDSGDNN